MIHPFQDGNGRVGRLIMFKECLKYNIVPFIIEDDLKMFYFAKCNRVEGIISSDAVYGCRQSLYLSAYIAIRQASILSFLPRGIP